MVPFEVAAHGLEGTRVLLAIGRLSSRDLPPGHPWAAREGLRAGPSPEGRVIGQARDSGALAVERLFPTRCDYEEFGEAPGPIA